MIRPILRYGERPLHQPAADVATFDDHLQRLIDDMIETMYAAPGIGLAATQLGVPLRVFVVDVSVGRQRKDLTVMVNPAFVEREGMQLEEEGCLSVPAKAPSRSPKARGFSLARFSMRWIISTESSSSIASVASSATSSCDESIN
jgi:peptide deformylase